VGDPRRPPKPVKPPAVKGPTLTLTLYIVSEEQRPLCWPPATTAPCACALATACARGRVHRHRVSDLGLSLFVAAHGRYPHRPERARIAHSQFLQFDTSCALATRTAASRPTALETVEAARARMRVLPALVHSGHHELKALYERSLALPARATRLSRSRIRRRSRARRAASRAREASTRT